MKTKTLKISEIEKNWWITSYRCHALAYMCGVSVDDIFSELFGKETGNAKGRGGSMHLFTDRLMGGFGIVGGQTPLAVGAAYQLKYTNQKDAMAICFLGDGATVQGVFHESLNMSKLLEVPVLYVIENNQWSMGTPLKRTHANYQNLAKSVSDGYQIECYDFNGSDYHECIEAFKKAKNYVISNQLPLVIEAKTQRFRGHSVSDPALYRSKESVKNMKKNGPIKKLADYILKEKILGQVDLDELKKQVTDEIKSAIQQAKSAPWPKLEGCLDSEVYSK